MADAPAFDWVCQELERRTSLDRLESRGTVRLALKEAGLDSRSITAAQLKVVLERVLPKELSSRGVQDSETLCRSLVSGVAQLDVGGPVPETPEEVFRRLAGATPR